MVIGIYEWLTTFEITQMILVREALADVRAPGRDAGGDSSDSDDEEGPEEDLEREIEGTKTQRRV